jgi:hypothetical protein
MYEPYISRITRRTFKVQIALEGFALDNAIEVPSHLKKNIFEAIEKDFVEVIPVAKK